jgi:nucleoside-diphosphate-sugar epimerase
MASLSSGQLSISTEEELIDVLSEPYEEDIEFAEQLDGDVMVLGAGGKMGPTLIRRILRAVDRADSDTTVYAVSRFSDPEKRSRIESWGAETISVDLLETGALSALPDCRNIIYMIGMKFGASDQRPKTWAINAYMPGRVARRFDTSRIVTFSTGNVYPPVAPESGGASEDDEPGPGGEYAQSCLGRERVFQYFSRDNDTPMCLIRLNYAVELRYGVLTDIAKRVYEGEPVPLDMGYVNAIWQGDANSICFRSLGTTSSPADVLNVTGTGMHSVRDLAERFGEAFGRDVTFEGTERDTALLNDASRCHEEFGEPRVSADALVPAIAAWLADGGRTLGKPTKYHVRDGAF